MKTSIGYYPLGEKRLPGVTSVLELALGFHSSMMDWAVKEGVTKLLNASQTQNLSITEAITLAQSARADILQTAQKKGTWVHEAVQHRLEGKKVVVKEEYAPIYNYFVKWLEQNPMKPILQEQLVVEEEDEYAGRFDYYGWVNNELALVDFKTSKYHKPEHGLQLAAYRHCLEKLGYPVQKMYILYLKEKSCKLVEHHDSYEMFKKVKDIFTWKSLTSPYVVWYPRTQLDVRKEMLKPNVVPVV